MQVWPLSARAKCRHDAVADSTPVHVTQLSEERVRCASE